MNLVLPSLVLTPALLMIMIWRVGADWDPVNISRLIMDRYDYGLQGPGPRGAARPMYRPVHRLQPPDCVGASQSQFTAEIAERAEDFGLISKNSAFSVVKIAPQLCNVRTGGQC